MSTRSKKNSAPRSAKDTLHQVVLAGRNAAGEQQQIESQAVFDQIAGTGIEIGGDRQNPRAAAGARHLHRQRLDIGVADLIIKRRLVHFDDLVAGSKDGDFWPAEDPDPGTADGGQQRDLGEAQASSRLQQHFVAARFASLRADVFAACASVAAR